MTSIQPADQPADQILDQLRRQELALNADDVQIYWQQQTSVLAGQFFQQQSNLMAQRVRLENVELQALTDALEPFETALSEGCANLAKQIEALDNAIAFVGALSTVTSVVTQIATRLV